MPVFSQEELNLGMSTRKPAESGPVAAKAQTGWDPTPMQAPAPAPGWWENVSDLAGGARRVANANAVEFLAGRFSPAAKAWAGRERAIGEDMAADSSSQLGVGSQFLGSMAGDLTSVPGVLATLAAGGVPRAIAAGTRAIPAADAAWTALRQGGRLAQPAAAALAENAVFTGVDAGLQGTLTPGKLAQESATGAGLQLALGGLGRLYTAGRNARRGLNEASTSLGVNPEGSRRIYLADVQGKQSSGRGGLVPEVSDMATDFERTFGGKVNWERGTNNGQHMATGWHPRGLAFDGGGWGFDFNKNYPAVKEWARERGYDVLWESRGTNNEHFHFQPSQSIIGKDQAGRQFVQLKAQQRGPLTSQPLAPNVADEAIERMRAGISRVPAHPGVEPGMAGGFRDVQAQIDQLLKSDSSADLDTAAVLQGQLNAKMRQANAQAEAALKNPVAREAVAPEATQGMATPGAAEGRPGALSGGANFRHAPDEPTLDAEVRGRKAMTPDGRPLSFVSDVDRSLYALGHSLQDGKGLEPSSPYMKLLAEHFQGETPDQIQGHARELYQAVTQIAQAQADGKPVAVGQRLNRGVARPVEGIAVPEPVDQAKAAAEQAFNDRMTRLDESALGRRVSQMTAMDAQASAKDLADRLGLAPETVREYAAWKANQISQQMDQALASSEAAQAQFEQALAMVRQRGQAGRALGEAETAAQGAEQVAQDQMWQQSQAGAAQMGAQIRAMEAERTRWEGLAREAVGEAQALPVSDVSPVTRVDNPTLRENLLGRDGRPAPTGIVGGDEVAYRKWWQGRLDNETLNPEVQKALEKAMAREEAIANPAPIRTPEFAKQQASPETAVVQVLGQTHNHAELMQSDLGQQLVSEELLAAVKNEVGLHGKGAATVPVTTPHAEALARLEALPPKATMKDVAPLLVDAGDIQVRPRSGGTEVQAAKLLAGDKEAQRLLGNFKTVSADQRRAWEQAFGLEAGTLDDDARLMLEAIRGVTLDGARAVEVNSKLASWVQVDLLPKMKDAEKLQALLRGEATGRVTNDFWVGEKRFYNLNKAVAEVKAQYRERVAQATERSAQPDVEVRLAALEQLRAEAATGKTAGSMDAYLDAMEELLLPRGISLRNSPESAQVGRAILEMVEHLAPQLEVLGIPLPSKDRATFIGLLSRYMATSKRLQNLDAAGVQALGKQMDQYLAAVRAGTLSEAQHEGLLVALNQLLTDIRPVKSLGQRYGGDVQGVYDASTGVIDITRGSANLDSVAHEVLHGLFYQNQAFAQHMREIAGLSVRQRQLLSAVSGFGAEGQYALNADETAVRLLQTYLSTPTALRELGEGLFEVGERIFQSLPETEQRLLGVLKVAQDAAAELSGHQIVSRVRNLAQEELAARYGNLEGYMARQDEVGLAQAAVAEANKWQHIPSTPWRWQDRAVVLDGTYRVNLHSPWLWLEDQMRAAMQKARGVEDAHALYAIAATHPLAVPGAMRENARRFSSYLDLIRKPVAGMMRLGGDFLDAVGNMEQRARRSQAVINADGTVSTVAANPHTEAAFTSAKWREAGLAQATVRGQKIVYDPVVQKYLPDNWSNTKNFFKQWIGHWTGQGNFHESFPVEMRKKLAQAMNDSTHGYKIANEAGEVIEVGSGRMGVEELTRRGFTDDEKHIYNLFMDYVEDTSSRFKLGLLHHTLQRYPEFAHLAAEGWTPEDVVKAYREGGVTLEGTVKKIAAEAAEQAPKLEARAAELEAQVAQSKANEADVLKRTDRSEHADVKEGFAEERKGLKAELREVERLQKLPGEVIGLLEQVNDKFRPGYFPQVRLGDWYVKVVDDEGKVVYNAGAWGRGNAYALKARLETEARAKGHSVIAQRRPANTSDSGELWNSTSHMEDILHALRLTDEGADIPYETLASAFENVQNAKKVGGRLAKNRQVDGWQEIDPLAAVLDFDRTVAAFFGNIEHRGRMLEIGNRLEGWAAERLPGDAQAQARWVRKAKNDLATMYRNSVHAPSKLDDQFQAGMEWLQNHLGDRVPHWASVTRMLNATAGKMVLGFANVKMVAVQVVHWLQIANPELSQAVVALDKQTGKHSGFFWAMNAVKDTIPDVAHVIKGDESHELTQAVRAMEQAGLLPLHRETKMKEFGRTPTQSLFGRLDKYLEITNNYPDRLRVLSTFAAARKLLMGFGVPEEAANFQAAKLARDSIDMTGANRSTIPVLSGSFGDLAMKYKSFLFNLMAKHKQVWDMGPGASLRKALGMSDGEALIHAPNVNWKPGMPLEEQFITVRADADWGPYGQMLGMMVGVGGVVAAPGLGYLVDWGDWASGHDSRLELKNKLREGARDTGSKTLEVLANGTTEVLDKGLIGALTGFNLSETGAMFFPTPEKSMANYLTPAAVSIWAQIAKRGVGALSAEDADFNPAVYKGMQVLKAFTPNSFRRIIENLEMLYNDNSVYDKDGRLVATVPGLTEDPINRIQVAIGGLGALKGEDYRIYERDKHVRDAIREKHRRDAFRVAQRLVDGDALSVVDMDFLQRVPGAGRMVKAEALKQVTTSRERLVQSIQKTADPQARMDRWNHLTALLGYEMDSEEGDLE